MNGICREVCKQKNDQYLFSVDAYAQITDPDTLIELIEQNRYRVI